MVAGRYGDSTWTSESTLTGEEMMDSLAANDSVYVTVKGNINPGILLLTPTEHDRFDHYDGKLRKES